MNSKAKDVHLDRGAEPAAETERAAALPERDVLAKETERLLSDETDVSAEWCADVCVHIRALQSEVNALRRDAERYRAINTPEIHDFIVAIEREALHQRERWASDHDAGKTDADWFWLIGYLAGKAINKPEKKLHHIITTAAACLNWHAHAIGIHQQMRPGIGPDKQPPKPAAIDAAAPSAAGGEGCP